MTPGNCGRPQEENKAQPLVQYRGWVKAGVLAGMTKTESDTFSVIAVHEGAEGSYPSIPTIARLTGHKASRLYGVLRKLVILGVIKRVGTVRYARSRGSSITAYSVTKPPPQGEALGGKASPPQSRKPPYHGQESLPVVGRQSDLKSVKEVGPPPASVPALLSLWPKREMAPDVASAAGRAKMAYDRRNGTGTS